MEDGIVRATIFVNEEKTKDGYPVEGILSGYQKGHTLRVALTVNVPYSSDATQVLETIFRVTNIGSDDNEGVERHIADKWAGGKNRSLSVGDVITLGDLSYSVDRIGFTVIPTPTNVVS